MNADLLIEIGTEELPPKALQKLSDAFTRGILDELEKAGLSVGKSTPYATPRRLAVLIKEVPEAQADRDVEKKGPSLKAAYDADGKPTKAVEGFARSCGISVDKLEQVETDKGVWLVFRAKEKGQPIAELIPKIVSQSLAKLPIPKRMRWGDSDIEFVRPAHWLVILHGKKVIDAEILGVKSSNKTYGHRFHANKAFALKNASEYTKRLQDNAHVICDMDARKQLIKQQVEDTAKEIGGKAIIDEDLLAEVTALVEWPVAVAGEFDKSFLDIPSEALIKTMQDNQKYFPVVNKQNKLKNFFITISNIDSKTPEKVKAGNERVIRPRLADAAFFWEQDKKHSLESFLPALDKVVFQTKLGTLGEKTRRVSALAQRIADVLNADSALVKRAATLSKCDLMTDMVGEFPGLQGVMGKKYAGIQGEPDEVALALDEQYMPRGAGDKVPSSTTGRILSISDKLDTLLGIFAIGQKPSGEKDPYALRRASLGVLRILIECELDLDLQKLMDHAAEFLAEKIDAGKAKKELMDYMLDRLRAYYLDRNVPVDVFDAVLALRPTRPLDFDQRIKAVNVFRTLPEAESLAAANKRVRNILKKSAQTTQARVDEELLHEKAELRLFQQMKDLDASVVNLFDQGNYEAGLRELSVLRKPVDEFFDSVMVMTDDKSIRNNRIALLSQMSALFLRAADLSRLQQSD